ncbi:unnamed protein product [Closterium sp. NIES-64]|nr:unnamed protein product [Closterium sp. NIES-64]
MGQDDHTCFATIFDADVAVIPLISSVVLILCPGDLFNASGQEVRTSIRHADPQTVKEWHRDEAIRVLKFFRTAVLAELRREGRKWEWAKPSEDEVQERLADCDEPLRDKIPDTVRDSDAGSGLLAMSALIWVVRRFQRLTGDLRRIATSMDKPTVSGLKALRNEMVALIKKQVPLIRSGKTVVAADACDDDGEEVHSASVPVGVAPNVADARGKSGVGVDEADAAAGKGVTGTEVVHGDDDGVQDREEEREEVEDVEMAEGYVVGGAEGYVVGGAEETGGRSADVENDEGEGKGATANIGEVGVEAAHGGGGMVEVGEGDNAAVPEQRGVDVHTDATAEKAGGERSRRKKAASGHPGSTAAGRQARLDVVDQLRAENRRLRADNALLERRLGEQTGRVDSLAAALAGLLEKVKGLTAQVADTDRKSEERLKEATSTMATTITEGLTDNMDSAIQSAKSFAELARQTLLDLDDPKGRAAVARATAVKTVTEHVTAEVGEARKGLEESFIKYIGAAQTNIAAAVAPRLVQPPPPTGPAQALPEDYLKSFKEDVLKAVTETTQQSFLASGLKIMAEVVGTVAYARRGSSPSANDAGQAQPTEGLKLGHKRSGGGGGGDGDISANTKRSKGGGGSGGGGGDGDDSAGARRTKGAAGSRVAGDGSMGAGDGSSLKQSGKSVVDILRKHWAQVGAASTGHGGGGPADEHATDDALPMAPPSVGVKPPRQGCGVKGLRDKEKAAAKTAPGGSAKAGQGPKTGVAEASAVPHQSPAGARHPTGPSAGRPTDVPRHADVPSAVKVGRAGKGAAVADALKEQLRLLAGHRAVQQAPPAVDVPSASGPRVVPVVAARTPADPKSALLRAQLGALASTERTQQASGSGSKPSSANVAPPTHVAADVEKTAEKGVRAALATGGGAVEEVPADADIAAIQAHLDAANPRTLAISDTEHVEPSAGLVGIAAEPSATGDAVGEGKSKRKGKAGSQRKTREKSEVKAADKQKGMAAETAADKDRGGIGEVEGKGENQKSPGEGTSTGRKGKDKSVGEGASTGRKGKEKAVGEGSSKGRKGKRKAEEEDEDVEEVEEVEQEEEEEEEEEEEGKGKERRGHGIRHDTSGDKQGWVGEIKVHGINRYIGKSRDKMELAYVHSIAYVVYDGFVSKVLMTELTGLDSAELERWKEVWDEVRILPTGMWTVMWARGTLLPKTRLTEILDAYRHYKSTGDCLHAALLPAIWYPVDASTEEGREKSASMMSAMIGRVSMCAAYGKTAAAAAKKEGDKEEKTDMAAWALAASACAVWCFVENGDAQLADAVEEGKSAAIIGGASQATADVFGKVMEAVLKAEMNRDRPLGEVAYNVAPALQRTALDTVYPGGNAGVDADVIARETVETMAFWGMCPVAGPKLRARDIAVPIDAQMKADLDNRGRKGLRGKKGTKTKGGTEKVKKSKKDSTTA